MEVKSSSSLHLLSHCRSKGRTGRAFPTFLHFSAVYGLYLTGESDADSDYAEPRTVANINLDILTYTPFFSCPQAYIKPTGMP